MQMYAQKYRIYVNTQNTLANLKFKFYKSQMYVIFKYKSDYIKKIRIFIII